ncbi:AMP-binding protein [Terrilactibacillus sp. BCM23-1]|uniref:AMP-binding protein n=1 Tax=Terrilactibacillus tamarindi TaxID=2599694 RepID=A0A6N8CPW6_9BACI|nr:long-chain fatty acid--CoA ligase [Terrilactibacillus tamarindi]MTT31698.1 AMP-binding protein [Terrilactibacillus tamarindi]
MAQNGLSRLFDSGQGTCIYSECPIYHDLKVAAEKVPNHRALYYLGEEMTYQDLYEKALSFASHLIKIGIKKGDRVMIMLPNCLEAVISYYGTLLSGAIVVMVNPLSTAYELSYLARDSRAKLIVCASQTIKVAHLIFKKTKLTFIIAVDIPFLKRNTQTAKFDIHQARRRGILFHFNQCVRTKRPFKPPIVNVHEDIALIQYTGGTEGRMKGVMLTHFNLMANAIQSQYWLTNQNESHEKMLCVCPFFHVYGLSVGIHVAVRCHFEMIILPKFQIEEVVRIIQTMRPTVFPGVPTMFKALVDYAKHHPVDYSSLKLCISGSSPLSASTLLAFESLSKGCLIQGYGLSEASPITHCQSLENRNVGIGTPYPDTKCRIISLDTGEDVNQGEVGELLVKGPQVMKGYWNQENLTQRTIVKGWLHTGDLAYQTKEGNYILVDRIKDVIIASGFNIYPSEIEFTLAKHPDIEEACVVGIPDEYRGETVKAYLVLKRNAIFNPADYDHHCRKFLSSYKVPCQYEKIDELPKSHLGKVLKRYLKVKNVIENR